MNRKKKQKPRRSIRLQSCNYSSPGEYFITLCIQNRRRLFGEVVDGEMCLNGLGQIAWNTWYQIPNRFENVTLDAFVVMPDHVHGIIGVGSNLKSENQSGAGQNPENENPVAAIYELQQRDENNADLYKDWNHESYRKRRRNMLLPKIIGWYKMNVSKQVNILFENTGNNLWQRNYYEHIIRNNQSLDRIRNYIINNPQKWDRDRSQ